MSRDEGGAEVPVADAASPAGSCPLCDAPECGSPFCEVKRLRAQARARTIATNASEI